MKDKLLITGATGFIGYRLAKSLQDKGYQLALPVRNLNNLKDLDPLSCIPIDDLEQLANLGVHLKSCKTVIHCAAVAHKSNVSREEFLAKNFSATVNFAKTCAENGVSRFIFLSSIGVNGASSDKPFTAFDVPNPREDYGISKLHAEIELMSISQQTGMEIVIIRPPLVYGAGAPGNFQKLLKLAVKNYPLPLGLINNKRSFISVDNLVDFIFTCTEHPSAANQVFLVSDDEDISTTELLKSIIKLSGKVPKLLPIPPSVLKLTLGLLGKKALIEKICCDLQIDITHTKSTLGWEPLISVEEGLRRCFNSLTD